MIAPFPYGSGRSCLFLHPLSRQAQVIHFLPVVKQGHPVVPFVGVVLVLWLQVECRVQLQQGSNSRIRRCRCFTPSSSSSLPSASSWRAVLAWSGCFLANPRAGAVAAPAARDREASLDEAVGGPVVEFLLFLAARPSLPPATASCRSMVFFVVFFETTTFYRTFVVLFFETTTFLVIFSGCAP